MQLLRALGLEEQAPSTRRQYHSRRTKEPCPLSRNIPSDDGRHAPADEESALDGPLATVSLESHSRPRGDVIHPHKFANSWPSTPWHKPQPAGMDVCAKAWDLLADWPSALRKTQVSKSQSSSTSLETLVANGLSPLANYMARGEAWSPQHLEPSWVPGRSGQLMVPNVPGPWPPGAGSPPSSPVPGGTGFRHSRSLSAADEAEVALSVKEEHARRREKLVNETRAAERKAAKTALDIEKRPTIATAAETLTSQGHEQAELVQAREYARLTEAVRAQEEAHQFEAVLLRGEVIAARARLQELDEEVAINAQAQLDLLDGNLSLDLHEPGITTVVALRREHEGTDLGISIGFLDDESMVITALTPGSPAERSGLLAPFDRIVALNGSRVDHGTSELLDDILSADRTLVVVEVDRAKTRADREAALAAIETAVANAEAFENRESLIDATTATRVAGRTFVTLQRDGPGEPYGLGIGFAEDFIIVTSIVPGSPADRCGLLAVMDRITAINGVPVDRSTPNLSELLPTDEASAVIDFDFDAYRVRSKDWPQQATLTTVSHSQWQGSEN